MYTYPLSDYMTVISYVYFFTVAKTEASNEEK